MYIEYFLHYLLLGAPGVYRASEKVYILSESSKSVIPEGAKSACGGESRKVTSILDTPSTSLRVVSPSTLLRTVSLSNGLSNHGSRLRLFRYDDGCRFQAFQQLA